MSPAWVLPFREWGGYGGCRRASAAIGAGRVIVGLHGSGAAGSDDGGRGGVRETGRSEVTMSVLGRLEMRSPRRVKG